MSFVVGCGAILVAACSSSSSNSGGGTEGGTGDDSGTASSSSGGTGSSSGGTGSSSGGTGGDAGLMATITCYSAADCNEGGSGKVCCYSVAAMATSCVAGQCAMGDYQQCASSDTECPMGYHCVMSPLGATVHYCMGGGPPGDGGKSEGGTGDAATE